MIIYRASSILAYSQNNKNYKDMSKKGIQPVSSEWLRGIADLSEYLRGLDERTIRLHLLSKGLTPRGIIGNTEYYHKKDVDRFMTSHCNLQALNK